MRDSFNRRIDYLRVSITDRCNLKCVYCMPPGGLRHIQEDEVLTDEEIVRIVRIACRQGLRKVRITGGEPLMRKNITGLVSSIKQTGVHDLALTTNGIMLSGLAGKLKKAGLDRVNISLDTMDPARYRAITNGGSLDRVWKAVEDAARAGLSPVKINVVPVRGLNDDEIPAFASLTFENDYHIRFIEFMPAACDGTWRRDRCVSSAEVMERISALGALERLEFRGRGPSRNFRIKGARGVIGIISPLSDHFCAFCNRLRLTADGKIRPCLFSEIKIDMKTPMRNGASDSEMEKLFCKAVKLKPRKHLLNDDITSSGHLKAMSEIGG
ncbi:MAG: GTP 3',8-cyclase MoaA [Deferribacteres bacterium]|nr:GTP 3',8-cyclase MoaA [Deferribacteres bacterium]